MKWSIAELFAEVLLEFGDKHLFCGGKCRITEINFHLNTILIKKIYFITILKRFILIRFLKRFICIKRFLIKEIGLEIIWRNSFNFDCSNLLVHLGSLFARVQITRVPSFLIWIRFPVFSRPTWVGFPWQHTFPSMTYFPSFVFRAVFVCVVPWCTS